MSMQVIQAKLIAPKSKYNSFGKYNYRSCEDIVEAAKPLLHDYGYFLIMCDDIVQLGERFYVKATASIFEGDKHIASAHAFARESFDKKGMDDAQITGSASSYARKYALNGLFAIDDNEDADVIVKEKSLPTITDERLKQAIVKIKSKEYTLEKLQATFELTAEQNKLVAESLLGDKSC